MGLYNNEEELKRRKGRGESLINRAATTSIPGRIATAGRSVLDFARQGVTDASQKKTLAGKVGSLARTAVTLPVAAAAPMAGEIARDASSVYRGVKDFGRAFAGIEQPSTALPRSAARVAAPTTTTDARVPPSTASMAADTAPVTPSPISRVSPVRVPGSGSITTSSGGAARIDPDTGEITVTGNPLRADSTRLPTNAQEPEKRRAARMVTYGGYRLPDRTEEAQSPARVRVSDIAEPKTVGAIPGYRRRVEAVKADMSADQTDAQRAQQQGQFEQGQSQAAAIAMQRQAQQQDQFEQDKALDERRIAGTEQQQQLAADQQEAKLAAEQRREGRTVAKEKEISAARAKFEAADTTAEKVAAAQMLNSLQGMKIDTPTKGKPPGLTPKETSQQIQGALKAFESAGGEAAAGTDFYTWMRQNDTRGYQAAFGNLTPKDIRVNAMINELTDEQLMSSDMAGVMNPGETPAQFRRRLDAEYRSKRGY